MQRQLDEMSRILQSALNPDGSIKVKQLEIQPKDTSVTAASGSVRVETNIGPINVLVV